jgi:hypothetical protein
MKTLSLHFWGLALIYSLIFATSSFALAADKIGNGGGVWVCQDSKLQIYDILFMDVFEARREYQLNLPESNSTPSDIVQNQKIWIEKFLTKGHEINKNIEYVEKNITWIDDIINSIPDAANKISPHPSTCKQGDWVATQLVNFTDDFRVLVRRDLYNSPFMSNLEKAAVYIHEGVYSFMRTEYGDTNSVRSRAIVGYLLSDLPDQEKQTRIEKVISQAPTDPGEPPATGWMCGIKPEVSSPLYTFEAATAQAATAGVLQACKDGENPMPNFPGFPGGGFPGMPGGGFGPPNNCKDTSVLCEPITTSAKKRTCEITVPFDRVFTGTGRTQLEAQKDAIAQCAIALGANNSCNDYSDLSCH